MKPFAAAVLAGCLVLPAAAFDNASCRTFLTGSWATEAQQQVNGRTATIKARSSYAVDGSFFQTMHAEIEGMPPQDLKREGSWDAGPGAAPDACRVTLTPKGEDAHTIELTVVDENTVANPEGIASRRVAD